MRWITTERSGGSDIATNGLVPDDLVTAYRQYGFVRVRGVLDPDQVERFRTSAEAFLAAHRAESLEKQGAFTQLVNVWQRDDNLRALTFDARLGRIAEQLAGFPLRLWHDQMLVKEPHNNVATEFHQDRPYWPHAGDRLPLSAWVALVDVPPERGCMTFLPGTQRRTGLRPQDLHHEEDLFVLDPSLRWIPRITVPLRAGDCTFHSGYTGHMALPTVPTPSDSPTSSSTWMRRQPTAAPRTSSPILSVSSSATDWTVTPSPARGASDRGWGRDRAARVPGRSGTRPAGSPCVGTGIPPTTP